MQPFKPLFSRAALLDFLIILDANFELNFIILQVPFETSLRSQDQEGPQ